MQMRNPINQVSGWKMKTAPLSEVCVGSLFVGIQTVPCVTETARPSSNVIKEPAPLRLSQATNGLSFANMTISFLISV